VARRNPDLIAISMRMHLPDRCCQHLDVEMRCQLFFLGFELLPGRYPPQYASVVPEWSVSLSPKDHRAGPFNITLRFSDLTGMLECIGMDLSSTGPPLTTTAVRKLNTGTLIAKGRTRLVRSGAGRTTLDSQRLVTHEAEVRLAQLRRGGGRAPTYGVKHFVEVADQYLSAIRNNRSALRAIAKRWGVKESAASKWLKVCRDIGLLDPTTKGKRSGRSAVASPATVKAKASVFSSVG
jgi:hypothetical protein